MSRFGLERSAMLALEPAADSGSLSLSDECEPESSPEVESLVVSGDVPQPCRHGKGTSMTRPQAAHLFLTLTVSSLTLTHKSTFILHPLHLSKPFSLKLFCIELVILLGFLSNLLQMFVVGYPLKELEET
jgi:hypothetical protein